MQTRLVQLTHPDEGRRTGLVDGNELHLLATYRSNYEFAMAALATGWKLRDLLSTDLSGIVLDYGEVHALKTEWQFLPAFDHPHEPGRCLVSGLAVGGSGTVWQYQGSGDSLCGHGEALKIEDLPAPIRIPEIAALYVIGDSGFPRRVGVAAGISGSRRSSLGPELILETDFPRIEGVVRLLREGREIWAQEFTAGQVPLALALAATEGDYFRGGNYRRSGDIHVHFFGAKLFGAVERPTAEDKDTAELLLKGFGGELRTRILVEQVDSVPVAALPL
jgi:hypothetical protein